ncbi:uncharacterized protein LOC132249240 [Alligator mississippiensis]|uniref:uncharacterized protein LOC132249240 n=1 Tax=Alligator mississippiensis TaxID=8496 RepID=UPI002877363C|nr:uncharacterized protein LOC132249240 [Alligator mississippiensis]
MTPEHQMWLHARRRLSDAGTPTGRDAGSSSGQLPPERNGGTHLSPGSHGTCDLLLAWIQDITAVIPDLIQPSDHYPLTPIHMGTYDAYRDRSTGGFLICSSGEQTWMVPQGLHQRGQPAASDLVLPGRFGFLDHGSHFHTGDMLGQSRLNLSLKSWLKFYGELSTEVRRWMGMQRYRRTLRRQGGGTPFSTQQLKGILGVNIHSKMNMG